MGKSLVCRTCLQINTPETCSSIIEVEQNSDILEMLSYSIPEMNMHLVLNPVICNKCTSMLKTLYHSKSQCLKIEENILKFAQASGQVKINLSEYFKHRVTHLSNLNDFKVSQLNTCKENSLKGKKIKKMNQQKKKINNNNNKPNIKTTCEGCMGCSMNASNPSYHLKTNHAPFTCFHCNKTLERIIDLRRHVLGHVKQRKCKICGKCFRDLTVLRRHLWSHTGAKSFACTLCPKRFQQKHSLDQHLLKHQGNENIKCSFCHKLFSTKYNAQVHMKTMHKKTEVCDLCGDRFYSKSELVKHLETNSKKCGNVIKPKVNEKLKQVEDKNIKIEPECVFTNEYGIQTDIIKLETNISDFSCKMEYPEGDGNKIFFKEEHIEKE